MTSENTSAADAATENFADLLAESFGENTNIEGSVVRGFVIGMEGDAVIIDVGLKSEGRVPLKELTTPGQEPDVNIGDEIEVYVERMEDKNGQAMLSREKARREEAWGVLEASFEKQERVTGVIFGKVKGGFTVDLSGAVAFLPGSQVDIRPVRDITPLLGTPQPFQILKMDRSRGNIVVSRRAVPSGDSTVKPSSKYSSCAECQNSECSRRIAAMNSAFCWKNGSVSFGRISRCSASHASVSMTTALRSAASAISSRP